MCRARARCTRCPLHTANAINPTDMNPFTTIKPLAFTSRLSAAAGEVQSPWGAAGSSFAACQRAPWPSCHALWGARGWKSGSDPGGNTPGSLVPFPCSAPRSRQPPRSAQGKQPLCLVVEGPMSQPITPAQASGWGIPPSHNPRWVWEVPGALPAPLANCCGCN